MSTNRVESVRCRKDGKHEMLILEMLESRLLLSGTTWVQEAWDGESFLYEGHTITDTELSRLQGSLGTSVEGQLGGSSVKGHTTGYLAPSDAQWRDLADNLTIVDSIKPADASLSLPASLDWSTTQYFPPIGDQGFQGSCTTWSFAYYTKTFQEALEHNWDLSGALWDYGIWGPTPAYQNKIFSPAFIYNQINNGGDNGSSPFDALDLVSDIGAATWAKMPFNQFDAVSWPSEAAWREAPLYRADASASAGFILDLTSSVDGLKALLDSGNLAQISIDAADMVEMATLDNFNNLFIDHENTVVGYDDNKSYIENGTLRTGAFKIANSWGATWPGETDGDGSWWLSYDAMEQRIGYATFYTDRIDYNPSTIAVFRINQPNRGEVDMTFGVGSHAAPTDTKDFWTPLTSSDGNDAFPNNKMVLDLSEFSWDKMNGSNFFVQIHDGGSVKTGTLISFSLEYYSDYQSGIKVDSASSTNTPLATRQNATVYSDIFFLPHQNVPGTYRNALADATTDLQIGFRSFTDDFASSMVALRSLGAGDVQGALNVIDALDAIATGVFNPAMSGAVKPLMDNFNLTEGAARMILDTAPLYSSGPKAVGPSGIGVDPAGLVKGLSNWLDEPNGAVTDQDGDGDADNTDLLLSGGASAISESLYSAMMNDFAMFDDAGGQPLAEPGGQGLVDYMDVAVNDYIQSINPVGYPANNVYSYLTGLDTGLLASRQTEYFMPPINDLGQRPYILGSYRSQSDLVNGQIGILGSSDSVDYGLIAGSVGPAGTGLVRMSGIVAANGVSLGGGVFVGEGPILGGLTDAYYRMDSEEALQLSLNNELYSAVFEGVSLADVLVGSVGYLQDLESGGWTPLNQAVDVSLVDNSLDVNDATIPVTSASAPVGGGLDVTNNTSDAVPVVAFVGLYAGPTASGGASLNAWTWGASGTLSIGAGAHSLAFASVDLPGSTQLGARDYHAFGGAYAGYAINAVRLGPAFDSAQVEVQNVKNQISAENHNSWEGSLNQGETWQTPYTVGALIVGSQLTLDSNGAGLDLHVYDAGGHHVGVNPVTGNVEIQIPGATFATNDSGLEYIWLPHSAGNQYTIMVKATAVSEAMPFTVAIADLPTQGAILSATAPVIVQYAGQPPSTVHVYFKAREVSGLHTSGALNPVSTDLVLNASNKILAGAISFSAPANTVPAGSFVPLVATVNVPPNIAYGRYNGVFTIGGVDVPVTLILAPEISITSSPVLTATEDVPYLYDVQSGVEGQPGAVYSLVAKPSQLSINPATGQVTGAFLNGAAGEYSVVVLLSSANGAKAWQRYTLDVLNAPPAFIGAPAALTATEHQTFNFDFNTDDEGVGGGVTYSLQNAPAWLNVVDAAHGTISGTPLNGTAGDFTVTVLAADTYGGVGQATFVLHVLNLPPVFINPPGDTSLVVGQTIDFNTDDEGQGPTHYSIAAGPGWLTMDSQTGVLGMQFMPLPQFDVAQPVTVRADDGMGGVTDYAFDLTVHGQLIALGPYAGATRASFKDADGDTIHAQLTGPTGAVYLVRAITPDTQGHYSNDTPGDLFGILADQTNARSGLKITVSPSEGSDGLTRVVGIYGSGPLGTLLAPSMDVVGYGIQMTGDGYIGALTIHNLSDYADIVMPGAFAPGGIVITANSLGEDTRVVLGSGLKSLKAVEWGAGSSLSAPWASAISITGNRRSAVAGEFGADLNLGHNSLGVSLDKLNVAGSIVGVRLDLDGRANSISAGLWTSGSLDAWSLGSMSLMGDKNTYRSGDLAADITLSGLGVGVNQPVLGSLSVSRNIDGARINVNGDIKSITAGWIVDSTIYAGYDPGAGAWGTGTFTGDFTIGSIIAKGSSKSGVDAFQNSTVAAHNVGSMKFSSVDGMTGGNIFGVILGNGDSLISATFPKWKWDFPGPAVQGFDDFRVAAI